MEVYLLPHYGRPGVLRCALLSSMSQERGMGHPVLFESELPAVPKKGLILFAVFFHTGISPVESTSQI